MAKSNRDRVSEVMDALKEGLGPFVLREYRMVYKGDFAREIDALLTTNAFELPRDAFRDMETLAAAIDIQGWLKLMWNQWNDVFREKLGFSERNYVSELMTARNDWAHQKAFTNDDAQRVADTATRLLEAVGAPTQAQAARDIAQELLRLRFEAEQKQAKKKTGSVNHGS